MNVTLHDKWVSEDQINLRWIAIMKVCTRDSREVKETGEKIDSGVRQRDAYEASSPSPPRKQAALEAGKQGGGGCPTLTASSGSSSLANTLSLTNRLSSSS